MPVGKEKRSRAQERRESLGKVLTRQEMFRIFDKHWVAYETVKSAENWRTSKEIVHAFSKNPGVSFAKAAEVMDKKRKAKKRSSSIAIQYLDSKPTMYA